MRRFTIAVGLFVSVWVAAAAADELKRREWTVDGVTREALVYTPPVATSKPCPMIFAFHMRGATMQWSAKSFAYHTHWPEAIVVYPQGLVVDPKENWAGWESDPGDQDDRDLKFFDLMLASLKKDYRVDEKRIFAAGHSNGGRFTYLLWAERGDLFAAVAPSAASVNIGDPTRPRPGNPAIRKVTKYVKPKPVVLALGENDPVARFEGQKRLVETLRKNNGCDEGKPWGEGCTLYSSKGNTPVLAYIHSGDHIHWRAEASANIIKFFKEFGKGK
jgi:polyhydroxybutyrate depolymerase